MSISGFGAISDCRPLLESSRHTFCEFIMIEYRRFAAGILMIYVTDSEISVLPVIWLLSWICSTHQRPVGRDITSATTKELSPENIWAAVGVLSLIALELEICRNSLTSSRPLST